MQTNRCLGFGGPPSQPLQRTGDRDPYFLVEALTAAELRKRDLKRELGIVEGDIARLKHKLADHASRRGTDVICGSAKEVFIQAVPQFIIPAQSEFPERYRALDGALRASPYWLQTSMLNRSGLPRLYLAPSTARPLREILEQFGRQETVTRVSLRKRR